MQPEFSTEPMELPHVGGNQN